MLRLRRPTVDASPPQRVCSDEDYDRLLTTARGLDFRSRRDRSLFALLRDTGMRRSEVARLKVSDVDMDASTIAIAKSKNGRPRTVPMTRAARLAMRRYLVVRDKHRCAHLQPLYLSSTHPMGLTPDAITDVFRQRSKEAGVDVRPHELRRALAARWAIAGLPDDALMEIAGWRSATMPHRYRSAVRAELARQSLNRLIDLEGRGI